MAVFVENICKFQNCCSTFDSLPDLIHHIEDVHIDFTSEAVERIEKEKPQNLPLSYVLKYSKNNNKAASLHADVKQRLLEYASKSVVSVAASSEIREETETLTESEDSNDLWIAPLYSSDLIIHRGNANTSARNRLNASRTSYKPFACPVPGCHKRYKNINGIKYHTKNGHKSFTKKTHKRHAVKSLISHMPKGKEDFSLISRQHVPKPSISSEPASAYNIGSYFSDTAAQNELHSLFNSNEIQILERVVTGEKSNVSTKLLNCTDGKSINFSFCDFEALASSNTSGQPKLFKISSGATS